MKTLFTLLFISLFSFTAIAQVPEPNVLSLRGIGGNLDDQVSPFVIKTNDGGFIVAIGSNSTSGTGNLDSFCTSGSGDIYLKYSNDGVLEWSKCLAPGGITFPLNSGDFIYGTGTDPSTGWAFVIGKEDATGSIIWRKTYGNNADAILRSMIATDDGGYIMAGETNYADTDFLIHYGSSSNADIGVLKLDSLGNKVWSTVLGGSGDERCWAILNGPNNGCYVIGNTPSDDFDCTGNHGGSSGSTDMYVARLDNNGNILWHHDLGGMGDDGGDGGYLDENGGIIITGSSGSSDGDVTHQINPTGYNIWVVDVDSNNNIIWNNCYGGGGQEFSTSVCKATDGSIWIAGQSQIKGGEVDTAYGNTDAWFVHADSIGNFINAKVLGGTGQDQGQMIYPLPEGGVITGGYYSVNNGAFSSLESYSSDLATDAFLAVFAPWPESVQQLSLVNNTVKIYPNPADEIVTVEPLQKDDYNIVITDVLGRVIYTTSLKDKVQIPVIKWQKGMYYVQVISSDGYRNVQKLIVE